MTHPKPVHFELEILGESLCQPLCENQRGIDAFERIGQDVEMTPDERFVTCKPCLEALGYAA